MYGTLSDTWELAGDEWTLVSTNGPQTTIAGSAYDAARGVVVIYGGRLPDTGPAKANWRDTWEWDGVTWTHFPPGPRDAPIAVCGMAYDPTRGKVIRHAGIGDGETFDQTTTWEWNGQVWTPIAQGPALSCFMFHDARRGTMIVVGVSAMDSNANETWEFDGVNWTQLAVNTPKRIFYACAYDTRRKVAVLWGGATWPEAIPHDNTYEWDGTQWAEVNAGSNPPSLALAAMAYDAKRRKTIKFGGSGYGGSYYNETWEYGFLPLRVTSLGMDTNGNCTVTWAGDAPPYRLRWCTAPDTTWHDACDATHATSVTFPIHEEQDTAIFGVVSDFVVNP